jgi:hypothetical protein
MNYNILIADTPEKLIFAVKSEISAGWIPQGGVSVTVFPSLNYAQNPMPLTTTVIYAQAMIKPEYTPVATSIETYDWLKIGVN